MLSSSRLRELLDYNPETGIFIWRIRRRGRFARPGIRAGTIKFDNRRQICIDQKLYGSGPLAVLYMTNQWPKQMVDHINGNPSDDRWSNLREANSSQNAANCRVKPSKKYSPLKGVTWHHGKYVAQIKVDYRPIWLGRFNTAEEAHAAYCTAAVKYFKNFAKSSRLTA